MFSNAQDPVVSVFSRRSNQMKGVIVCFSLPSSLWSVETGLHGYIDRME